MTTAAEELRTAAQALRTATFRGAVTATPTVAALIRARRPLASLLERALARAPEAGHPEDQGWCSPETCDLSAALAIARAINCGGQPRPHAKPSTR